MPDLPPILTNLGAPLPLGTKLRLLLRNTIYKIRHRSHCCGHPGQPGC